MAAKELAWCAAADFRQGWRHPRNEGVLFEGEDGKWIWVSRQTIMASDGNAQTSRILNEPLGANAIRLEVANSHMGNFIHCCRNGGCRSATSTSVIAR